MMISVPLTAVKKVVIIIEIILLPTFPGHWIRPPRIQYSPLPSFQGRSFFMSSQQKKAQSGTTPSLFVREGKEMTLAHFRAKQHIARDSGYGC